MKSRVELVKRCIYRDGLSISSDIEAKWNWKLRSSRTYLQDVLFYGEVLLQLLLVLFLKFYCRPFEISKTGKL